MPPVYVTRKRKPLTTAYSLHNQELASVESAKYLGVEISNNLNWTKHVQSIAAKANRTSAFVYRNIRGCSHSTHTNCYKGLVRPTLEYASPVWDPHQKTLVDSLEKVQRRAARRIVQDFSKDSSATTILENLKLTPLKERQS